MMDDMTSNLQHLNTLLSQWVDNMQGQLNTQQPITMDPELDQYLYDMQLQLWMTVTKQQILAVNGLN